MPITDRQIKLARANIKRLLSGQPLLQEKKAFVPMDQGGMMQPPSAMPQGAPPPGAQGMPPGMPPMDPAAMGMPPMDPAAMGMPPGPPPGPPTDPAAGGGDPNAGLPIIQMTAADLMQFVQELMSMGMGGQPGAGANEGGKPKGKQALEGKLDELASKVDMLVQGMGGGAGGMPPGMGGMPPGMGAPMGDPGMASIPPGAEPMVPDMSGAMGSGLPPKMASQRSPARALQSMIARMKR